MRQPSVRGFACFAVGLAGVLLSAGCHRGAAQEIDAALTFMQDGHPPCRIARDQLGSPRPVTTWDPYYRKDKTFSAVPLAPILARGFAGVTLCVPGGSDCPHDLLLRARDGYTVPLRADRLMEPGAHIAVADLDAGGDGWEPIGPGRADPRPFYLFWTEPHQRSLETHPRPWQLVSIELSRFETRFPHVLPHGLPTDAPAWRGLSLFRDLCIRCHAINREGGRVGPDLNVPQSIVEYRPASQIREYIRDPRRFRYGTMPPHLDLTPADLDALLAYFAAMKTRKHDAEGGAP